MQIGETLMGLCWLVLDKSLSMMYNYDNDTIIQL
jgi:hypothetical protein